MTTGEDSGAGASAQRTYDRRRANDEAKIRAKWGRLGGLAVALTDERQSTAAWASGARGERVVGQALDGIAGEGVRILHDRRIPRSTANIDHIAITTAGVWVVDAKRYKAKRPELRVEGGIIRPRVEKLLVGGRDHTSLVDGVLKQIARVQDVLPEIPVQGALCFVDADWPLFGGAFTVGGVDVTWPKRLAAQLVARDDAGVDVEACAGILADRFVAA